MTLNKTIKAIIVLGSSIAFLLLCVYVWDTHEKVRSTLFELQTKYTNTRSQLLDTKEILYYTIISSRENISNDLYEVLPQNVCILRLHDVACMGCYAENVIRFSQKMRKDSLPFFILSTYSNEKQLNSDLSGIISLDSVNHFNINQYGILPADSINRPYLFIRDSNDKIQNVYIFEKGEYGMLDKYINALK